MFWKCKIIKSASEILSLQKLVGNSRDARPFNLKLTAKNPFQELVSLCIKSERIKAHLQPPNTAVLCFRGGGLHSIGPPWSPGETPRPLSDSCTSDRFIFPVSGIPFASIREFPQIRIWRVSRNQIRLKSCLERQRKLSVETLFSSKHKYYFTNNIYIYVYITNNSNIHNNNNVYITNNSKAFTIKLYYHSLIKLLASKHMFILQMIVKI